MFINLKLWVNEQYRNRKIKQQVKYINTSMDIDMYTLQIGFQDIKHMWSKGNVYGHICLQDPCVAHMLVPQKKWSYHIKGTHIWISKPPTFVCISGEIDKYICVTSVGGPIRVILSDTPTHQGSHWNNLIWGFCMGWCHRIRFILSARAPTMYTKW